MLAPRHLGRSELMFSLFQCKLWLIHRTDVDTQLSKFVVNSASVARQIHQRPLPPFLHPEGWFQANGSHHPLEPTAPIGARCIAAL
jgi:hypothetical protein